MEFALSSAKVAPARAVPAARGRRAAPHQAKVPIVPASVSSVLVSRLRARPTSAILQAPSRASRTARGGEEGEQLWAGQSVRVQGGRGCNAPKPGLGVAPAALRPPMRGHPPGPAPWLTVAALDVKVYNLVGMLRGVSGWVGKVRVGGPAAATPGPRPPPAWPSLFWALLASQAPPAVPSPGSAAPERCRTPPACPLHTCRSTSKGSAGG